MDEKEAYKIILDYYMDAEFYLAENDCLPKGHEEDFHKALEIALVVLKENSNKFLY